MIADKFTTEFVIKRQVWTTETVDDEVVTSSEEEEITEFLGYRQQASAEYAQNIVSGITKPHIIWCPVTTPVIEGDVLTSIHGNDRVRARQVNNDGNNAHIELLVEFMGFDEEEDESGS